MEILFTITGSQVISDNSTTLVAKNNITIEAAQNSQTSSSFRDERQSGLMSAAGGAGIFIGKKQNSTETSTSSTSHTASTVASIGGNVTIVAGNQYSQVGSDVMSPNGDITIAAQNVSITEVQNTSASQTETKSKQSGLTVAISNPLLSAAQGIQGMAQAARSTSSGRMQGLAAANIAMQANNAKDAYNQLQTPSADGQGPSALNQLGGTSISASLGSSSSQSNTSSQTSSAQGSRVIAGGSVHISASGAGQASNILIQGSQIQAGDAASNQVSLSADNRIDLLAAKNTTSQTSSNSNSSSSIGASMSSTGGLGFNASTSKGKGHSDGADLTYTNTQIQGHQVNLTSGGDTRLSGAVIAANSVRADIKGNLTIESLQDTSTYQENQSTSGASLSLSASGIPTAGGISASGTAIHSNYASVGEQSGIQAGDGGFQVNVAGHTTLTGGVITSSQAAIDAQRNSFNGNTTEGLSRISTTDLQNQASYSANSAGGTIGVGSALSSSGAGVGKAGGSASSTTQAGISGLAGHSAARTEASPTAALTPIFNKDKVKADVQAQVQITTAFGQNASKAVGDYAGGKFKDLTTQADNETDPTKKAALLSEASKWDEGGTYRVLMHSAVGALGGGAGGALGAASSQTLVPLLGEQVAKLDIPLEVKQVLLQAAGAVIGAATGGASGVAAGVNATSQNYLTSSDLRSKDQKIKDCRSQGNAQCEIAVLKEYEAKTAKNTANINYQSVLSEESLKAEKTSLEKLVQDPTVSDSAKAQARQSIKEIDVAINVIQKSPVLKDAAEIGMMVVDVVMLGELAAAKALTSAVVKEFIELKFGKKITDDAATVIANNFYKEGNATPQALATTSGVVIQAVEGKTTTVLGNYATDMKGIITEQTGIPKSMGYLDPKPNGFNVLNVPDEYAAIIAKQNPEAFWNQVNKPFIDAAIKRGDDIYLATRPDSNLLIKADGSLSGYGKEIEYLTSRGYAYNPLTGKMVKK